MLPAPVIGYQRAKIIGDCRARRRFFFRRLRVAFSAVFDEMTMEASSEFYSTLTEAGSVFLEEADGWKTELSVPPPRRFGLPPKRAGNPGAS